RRIEQSIGLLAGIDDHRGSELAGLRVRSATATATGTGSGPGAGTGTGTDDVAILLDGTNGEGAHVEGAHPARPFRSPPKALIAAPAFRHPWPCCAVGA